jgi:hypothetical protein
MDTVKHKKSNTMDLQAYQDFLIDYSNNLNTDIPLPTIARLGLMAKSGKVIGALMENKVDAIALKDDLGDTLSYFLLVLNHLEMPLIAIGAIGGCLQVPLADNYLFCARNLYTCVDSFLRLKLARESLELLIAIIRIGLLYDIKLEDIVSYSWDKLKKRLDEGELQGFC